MLSTKSIVNYILKTIIDIIKCFLFITIDWAVLLGWGQIINRMYPTSENYAGMGQFFIGLIVYITIIRGYVSNRIFKTFKKSVLFFAIFSAFGTLFILAISPRTSFNFTFYVEKLPMNLAIALVIAFVSFVSSYVVLKIKEPKTA